MSESQDDRAALEQQLLRQPFDAALRRRYAESLLREQAWDEALTQAELLAQQQPLKPEGALLAAQALLGRGEREAALKRYDEARTLAGFAPLPALEALGAQAVPANDAPLAAKPAAPRLQLVGAGEGAGAPAEVRAIQQVSEEKVRFSSIVGMDELKKTIRLKIIEPYLKPGLFARFRMGSGGGLLLYGAPGCGKTMLARAVANECNAAFVAVGISDVLNMYLGESERNLAAMFDKARAQAPCVLFFDELDALAYARAKAHGNTTRTVVNEFLSQLDGIGRENHGVLVLAATNMPWDVDGAMKRPGRFSRQIFVPPPDAAARAEMLRIKLTGVPMEADLSIETVARRAEHYSGADIDGLIEMAKESALADSLDGAERGLNAADFEHALARMQPSTLDWLRTVRNVVKYAGEDGSYKDVEQYLKRVKLL
ncbi:ATP-binding protein [Aquabacterium sp.]|uniref:ATP-binding protein n=1 Tax=Aquabacterium sp. TaxID=1872578 RepID=UPI0037851DED